MIYNNSQNVSIKNFVRKLASELAAESSDKEFTWVYLMFVRDDKINSNKRIFRLFDNSGFSQDYLADDHLKRANIQPVLDVNTYRLAI